MTEIAPCPMPGCGGECFAGSGMTGITLAMYQVVCTTCACCSGNYLSKNLAIKDHNALCGDVELAKNLRTVAQFGVHIAHEIGGGRDRWILTTRSGTDAGSTLDAALAELAKKIGGSDDPG